MSDESLPFTGQRMISPPPLVTSASPPRRVFDLLVIVAVAGGLLGLAWQVARQRGRVEEAPLGSPLAGATSPLPEPPELQLTLPIEKFGMVLTRQHVEGDSVQALAALDQRCREVLASADEWVLSLAVSPEEQQLLDSLAGTEPLPGSSAQLFPLTQPTGRVGIRVSTSMGGPLTPALSPTMESSQPAEPNVGEREQKEQSLKDATGSGAVAGRRLICWGFIVSDGAEGHTVWFAQPREKWPRSAARESHTP